MDRIIKGGHNILVITEMTLGKKILGKCQIIDIKILKVNIEVTIEKTSLEEREVGVGKDHIQEILEGLNRSSSSRPRSDLRASINRDNVRCFKCREYDRFAKDCLNSQTEKTEPEQIQQMYN